jgi:DNA-binding transcriptional MocR family regulator
MSAFQNRDGKTIRRSTLTSFSARPTEMLESPAYRVLSRAAHQVMSRIEIELRHHGGKDNGKLPVTFDDFIEYGLDRHAIAPAISELEALGFIEVKERGRAGNAEHRSPNKFRLTFSNNRDKSEPSNEWRKITTMEEAHQLARTARQTKRRRSDPKTTLKQNHEFLN